MISKELARCIAHVCGDGYLGKKYIRYANKNEELLIEFAIDIKACFGNIYLYWGIGNSGTPFIQFHNKKINTVFLKFIPSYKSKDIFIPSIIKNSNIHVKKEFLRAFFDDEGGASLRFFKKTKEWKRDIKIGSNSKKILDDIYLMLRDDFDILPNKVTKATRGENKKKDRTYHLSVTGKTNYLKFKQRIGFKSECKHQELNLIILSYGKTYKRNKSGFMNIHRKLLLNRESRKNQNNKAYKTILLQNQRGRP